MERTADGAEKRQAEGSEVVEYRPYEDGMLQAEVRTYTRRDGGRSERGPYWYFRFHEAGRRSSTWGAPTIRRRCSPRSGRRGLRARGRGIVGKKDTSGGGTVRTRKDGLKEARLLVPKEYRAGVGRIYLYFYGMTEREAKDERSATLSDLIQRGPRLFDARRITFGEWLERWIDSLPGTVAVNTQGFYEHRARTYPKPVLGASSSPSSPPSTSTAFTGISREARARLRAGRSRLRPLVFRPLRRHPRRALE